MISAKHFLAESKKQGIGFITGVPCSFLTPLINRVISDDDIPYVGATSEGEAMAMAAGAWLCGSETLVMCQNSGLGNAINPLTSLNWPFQIPSLMIVTWRGQPGLKDEPQHELMGQITGKLLDNIKVGHRPFPRTESDIGPALDEALGVMRETNLPFAMIMEKDSIIDEPLSESPRPSRAPGEYRDVRQGGQQIRRIDVLERVLSMLPNEAAVIATTGKCGRELFTLADREQNLYQVGSMGGASAMGLGVALNTPRPVIVLDGDGAALMKMGNIATVGAHAPENFIHIVLDNGTHDSTGGQSTVSPGVDFAMIAIACGYARATQADEISNFAEALKEALTQPGPHMIHVRIMPGSIAKLGRPTVTPDAVARRFRKFIISPY